MNNPFEQIPPGVRAWIYIIATVVILAIGAWLTAEGNILLAIITFFTALQPLVSLTHLRQTDPRPPLEGFTTEELIGELDTRQVDEPVSFVDVTPAIEAPAPRPGTRAYREAQS